jgi:hypothetical protein
MGGGVFLIQEDGKLVEMREQPYDSEALLQELLAKYPNLLAGDQMDGTEARRWLLVSREMAIPGEEDGGGRWTLDHLFLDQDAIPTLVEVKRGSDTRIRREVVGQMLDYAANAVLNWPVETIRAKFEKTCELQGLDPSNELARLLGDEGDGESFWQNTKTNLQAGRVRLVFVADEIPSELRRVVEFLNEQMDPAEVLAVEVKQYIGQGRMKTLVPRLIGQTIRGGTARKPSSKAPAEVDKFGLRVGSEVSKALSVLTNKPKNMKQIMEEAGMKDTRYSALKKLAEAGKIGKSEEGYFLNTKWGTPAEVTQAHAEELRDKPDAGAAMRRQEQSEPPTP